MDCLLASYRPMIREKKWYWPSVLNALNLSDGSTRRLHCAVTLEFCFTCLSTACKGKSLRKLIPMLTIELSFH